MANPNIVNVATINGGNLGFNLSNTLDATLATVAADVIVKVNQISIANVDGSSSANVNIFVDGMGSGATGFAGTGADSAVYLAKTIAVPADSTLLLLSNPIYLMEGDVLKGGASASGDLDCFISYEVLNDA